MANPEHVKIVKAGREALDLWWDVNCSYQPYPNQITLDLSGADLKGILLPRSSLMQADLRGANLEQASLLGTNFESALLTSANLKKADLIKAGFDSTKMDNVNLDGAICGENKNCIKAMPSPLPAQGQSQALHIYCCGESPIPIEQQRIWINFEKRRVEQKARLAV